MTSQPPIVELESVQSTMLEAVDLLARGAVAPWTTILARQQTAGKGRLDRAWLSSPGDALLATVIVPLRIPAERLGLVALAAGLAIVDALATWAISASLKWPNDIYLDEKKLGGVLIRTQSSGEMLALVGIGINLLAVPPDLAGRAICLAEIIDQPPSPRRLIEEIVRHLQAAVTQLESTAWSAVVDSWTAHALWIGKPVTVVANERVTGIFRGVDEFGRMILHSSNGDLLISVGDVERGPREVA